MKNNNKVKCRVCNSEDLTTFLNLGKLPLADRLVTKEQLHETEPAFPLNVAYCNNCSLVQILETVSSEFLFCNNYPYFSSVSTSLLEHTKKNVTEIIEKRSLTPNSFVLEIASNDGYLLKNYLDAGIPCLGIDPASEPVNKARQSGVPTLCTFFTRDLAVKLVKEGYRADVIHANNVLAHVADINGFIEGIKILLKESGVAVIEVPYIKDLIDNKEFDTIYHQHLCYFSVTALQHLFYMHDLYLNDIKKIDIHGGSLRLFVEYKENISDNVKKILISEKDNGIDKIDYYLHFSKQVNEIKVNLKTLLEELRKQGKKIAGYGAAAKGCTLLNYINIDKNIVEYLVDKNSFKQGKYMTGMHQYIHHPEKLISDMPDYVLLLSWNFTNEILFEQREYRQAGGKFIIPIPYPRII